MIRYSVYLETADDGRSMAHVLALPGCFVRAPTREQALDRVPEAISETLAWLRSHGELAPPVDDPVEIEIAEEITGLGPFDRGDAAALFSPERKPVTPEEMERHFRLMAHARADLLALVRDLPDDMLDWQPAPESLSIRHLLRHVGNAEEWYVSRLVDPETLPPEWERDGDLPVFDFLQMERSTAVDRLRQLTGEEMAAVLYPTLWTRHPGEPWTVRKALRRFLEHEREHTDQAREILAAWRRCFLARLAAERAGFLEQFLGLDERGLTQLPVFDGWTAKDLLAHVAAWDELFTWRVERVLAGRESEIVGVDPEDHNATLYAERRGWSLKRAVEACVVARRACLEALTRLPDEELHRWRSLPWGETSVRQWAEWRARHDAAHAADLAVWRGSLGERGMGAEGKAGPKVVLLAVLAAARAELLAVAALVPSEERQSRPVCGEWTLKDVLGHVADWEWVGVEGLRHMAAGRPPRVEHVEDIEAWNRAHAEVRRGQSWEEVWADLHAARRAMLDVLESEELSQASLGRTFSFPWGQEGTPYEWLCIYVDHDRSHARDLVRSGCFSAGS